MDHRIIQTCSRSRALKAETRLRSSSAALTYDLIKIENVVMGRCSVPRPRKPRARILVGDVDRVFDNDCIGRPVQIARLPADANVAAFENGVRAAARIYAEAVAEPDQNELHSEIAKLHDA